MRNDLNRIEAIENYIAGTMPENERLDFESQLKLDTNLQNEVDLQRQLVNRLQMNAFKAEMIASHNTLVGKTNWLWARIALNVFLGLLIFAGTAVTTAFLAPSSAISEGKTNPDTVIAIPVNATDTVQEIILESEPEQISNEEVESSLSSHTSGYKTNKIVKKPKIDLHQGFIQPFLSANLDATIGGTIETIDSKSLLHFPGNSLVTKDGRPVNGLVEIRYREYRNPGQMAYSGIPMTYEENGLDYNFNSAGMIEVRAFQNGQELQMKPGVAFTMDYNVTEQLDSCFFFALDDSSQQWDKKQDILFANGAITSSIGNDIKEDNVNKTKGILRGTLKNYREKSQEIQGVGVALYRPRDYKKGDMSAYTSIERVGSFIIEGIEPGQYIVEITCDGFDRIVIDSLTIYEGKISELDVRFVSSFGDTRKNKKSNRPRIFKRKKPPVDNSQVKTGYDLRDSVGNTSTGFLSSTSAEIGSKVEDDGAKWADAQIAKNNMVSGLQCEGFGVYNCDQINRLVDPVSVKGRYVDLKGALVAGIYMLTLIDLNINASFSFSSLDFKCQKNGKNILLLFTVDKLYGISAQKFNEMNVSNNVNYTFEMTDVTDQVRNTDELKTYLGL